MKPKKNLWIAGAIVGLVLLALYGAEGPKLAATAPVSVPRLPLPAFGEGGNKEASSLSKPSALLPLPSNAVLVSSSAHKKESASRTKEQALALSREIINAKGKFWPRVRPSTPEEHFFVFLENNGEEYTFRVYVDSKNNPLKLNIFFRARQIEGKNRACFDFTYNLKDEKVTGSFVGADSMEVRQDYWPPFFDRCLDYCNVHLTGD